MSDGATDLGGARATVERVSAEIRERDRRARLAEQASARAAERKAALLKRAEDDLIWLFACGDSVMGRHGQGLDPAGGGVFHAGNALARDGGLLSDNPSTRLHVALRQRDHRGPMLQRSRVVARWHTLSPAQKETATLAYDAPRVYRNRVTCRRCAGLGASLVEASFGRYEGERCRGCNGVGLVEDPAEARIREAFRRRTTSVVVVEGGKTIMRKDAAGDETKEPLTVDMTSTSLVGLVLRTRAVTAAFHAYEAEHANVVTLRPERAALEAFLGWEASQAGEKHGRVLSDATAEATALLGDVLWTLASAMESERDARRASMGLARCDR